MATPYSVVIQDFLGKVSDYKLLELVEDERTEVLVGIMKTACTQFTRCKEDLRDRDDELQAFNSDLSDRVIDIISQLMCSVWLTSSMYDSDLLESRLNTKDFTEYSPAKLIEQMRYFYEFSVRQSKQLIKDYTYETGDIVGITLGN